VTEDDLPAVVREALREPVNGWLHLGGAVLAALGLVVLAHAALDHGTARHVVGALVFGTSAILMFAASATYHLRRHSRRAALLRQLDHAMIYVFIAGTYTPVCLVALWRTGVGKPMLALVWTLAAAGIVLKLRWPGAPRALSTLLYIGLGWLGAAAGPVLLREAPPRFFAWLITGGVLYTVGALVYWRRWPRWGRPGVFGYHELWHVFVLGASASHYWAVLRYLMG
jgi:hemolysin III